MLSSEAEMLEQVGPLARGPEMIDADDTAFGADELPPDRSDACLDGYTLAHRRRQHVLLVERIIARKHLEGWHRHQAHATATLDEFAHRLGSDPDLRAGRNHDAFGCALAFDERITTALDRCDLFCRTRLVGEILARERERGRPGAML